MQIVRRAVLSILIASFAVLALPVLAQQVIATVPVGQGPQAGAVNPVTNKTYVPNTCGNDSSCHTHSGTVAVIDGVNDSVIAIVPVGSAPNAVSVNSITNKIYIVNFCGND